MKKEAQFFEFFVNDAVCFTRIYCIKYFITYFLSVFNVRIICIMLSNEAKNIIGLLYQVE